MVALTSLVVVLAAIPSILAAPHGHYAARSNPHRRAACNAKTTSVSSSAEHTTTSSHHSTTTTHHASSTTSSAKATSTGGAKVSTNALGLVWPLSVGNAVSTWSTSTLVSNHVPLNDKSLNIYSGASTSHVYDNAPDGTAALRAFYSKGSVSPGKEHTPEGLTPGFSLYAKTGIDLSQGTEVVLSYKAWFQEGFEFNKGGKMPGLYGGTSDAIAKTCSGGNHGENECWSARMMFRTKGAGELYAYFPTLGDNDTELKKVEPETILNDTYGTSVGRGSFTWKTGAWTAISQRIKLNDIGKQNGEFQVWVNGESIMNISGLEFRTSKESLVRGAQLETFFGGHTADWASPKDQYCWFKDISTAILN